MEHFQKAIELDKDYALAWAGLAVRFAATPITGDVSSLQVLAPARNAVSHATRSAPDLAETHTAAGFLQFWLEWNFVQAEVCFRRAVQLDPSDSMAHRTLAIVLAYQRRDSEAAASAQIACELDPLNVANFALASQLAYFARELPRALTLAQRAIAVDPVMWVGHMQLAQALERRGDHAAALLALAEAGRLSGNNSKVMALKGYIHAASGQASLARDTLQQLAELRSKKFVPPYADALIWLGLGELEQVALCLNRCVEVHDVHLSFLLVDAKWDAIGSLPWFDDLRSRCAFQLHS
jgi:Flp pilus assembly protein TadD